MKGPSRHVEIAQHSERSHPLKSRNEVLASEAKQLILRATPVRRPDRQAQLTISLVVGHGLKLSSKAVQLVLVAEGETGLS